MALHKVIIAAISSLPRQRLKGGGTGFGRSGLSLFFMGEILAFLLGIVFLAFAELALLFWLVKRFDEDEKKSGGIE